MNYELIIKYFNINLSWKNDKPNFKFILKEEEKIRKDKPIKCIK